MIIEQIHNLMKNDFDCTLRGINIKIAIFDDKIEIISKGKLLPTEDFNEMDAG